MITALAALTVGVAAGIMAAFFGIGGGVIIIPSLMIFFEASQKTANGTTLAAMMLPVAFFAVRLFYKHGLFSIRVAGILALGLFTGIIGGSFLAVALPADVLRKGYALFLLFVAWQFITSPAEKASESSEICSSQPEPKLLPLLTLGAGTGIFAGLFGIGGGVILVWILVRGYKLGLKSAIATSLAALLPPSGLGGVIVYAGQNHVDWFLAAFIAAGLVLGAAIGALVSLKSKPAFIKKAYAIFLVVLSVMYLVNPAT